MSAQKFGSPPKRIFATCIVGLLLALPQAGCTEVSHSRAAPVPAAAPPQAEVSRQRAEQTQSKAAPALLASADAAKAPAATATDTPQRHIAVRQFLFIESDPDKLQATHQAAVARCQPPACEMLESTYKGGTQYEVARATLKVRILPAQAAGYVAEATRDGEVVEQRTESEDKTDQVIDTDARLRNLNELRDRLRNLLKTSGAKLSEIIEIERELARVQGELESAQGQRKLLAAETERTTLILTWQGRRSLAESGTFATLKNAFTQSGRTLAESLAALVTFLVAILPWVLVLGAIVQGLRLWWRSRRKQTEDQ